MYVPVYVVKVLRDSRGIEPLIRNLALFNSDGKIKVHLHSRVDPPCVVCQIYVVYQNTQDFPEF